MDPMMMFAGGANLLSAWGSYRKDKAEAESKRKIQAYRNNLVSIADAVNQNAITQNTTLTIQQSAKQSVFQKRDEMGTRGAVASAAAAAGVRGRSVNATIMDVQRNAGLIEKQRQDDLEGYFLQEYNQRVGSSMSKLQSTDMSYIPKPSINGYLTGALLKTAGQGIQGGWWTPNTPKD